MRLGCSKCRASCLPPLATVRDARRVVPAQRPPYPAVVRDLPRGRVGRVREFIARALVRAGETPARPVDRHDVLPRVAEVVEVARHERAAIAIEAEHDHAVVWLAIDHAIEAAVHEEAAVHQLVRLFAREVAGDLPDAEDRLELRIFRTR